MSRGSLTSFKHPGGSFIISDVAMTTGKYWFVHSGDGDSSNSGTTQLDPMATVDQAINKATASEGDVIIVMPGHAESFTATNGFDVDKIGLTIRGLGQGSNRPTFTFADTDAQINIGAAGVLIENLRFNAGISAVVAGVQVEGAADVTFKNCDWYWGGTTGWDFVIALELEASSDRVTVENCRFLAEPAANAGAASAISFASSDNLIVRHCEFMGNYSTSCILNASASEGLMFTDNLVHNTNAGEPYLEVHASTTGIIADIRGLAGGATIAANAVAIAMVHCEPFVCNTTGTVAIVTGAGGDPSVDAD
ncbi:hypothetical protein LCGC14_0583340 [marine sediment metagenome]|uniref:Right handed beta helix domain-containing protein n=1 Tax=marine sediment metagenome TaxID=412755 RepID=A0A0F9RKR5_9ZZZZ